MYTPRSRFEAGPVSRRTRATALASEGFAADCGSSGERFSFRQAAKRGTASALLMTLTCLLAVVAVGCGGGSTSTLPAMTVSLDPSGAGQVAEGQALVIQATVTNDATNEGVRWSLAGPGTLSDESTTSATYHAPKTISSASEDSATLTATSIANPNRSAELALSIMLAPLVTTSTLPQASVGSAYAYLLQATGGKGGYTWEISAGSLPAWASFDPHVGEIGGTPDTTGTWKFSVTVTDSASVTSAAQALTLVAGPPLPPVISTKSLPDASIGVPYDAELQVNGGQPPYTWSVSGEGLPSWARLDSATGVISGMPDAAGSSSFTIEVSDSETTVASATQPLSVLVKTPDSAHNAELKGQYAFLLQGFEDPSGNRFDIVGSLQADGNGKISGGVADSNGPEGYKPEVSFSGTYTVGSDNRGFLVLSDSSGDTTTYALAVGSLNASGVATRAGVIEFDAGTSGKRGSGAMFLQDPLSFQLSSLQGPYGFQIAGQADAPGTRTVVTGVYTTDGHGNLANGDEEVNRKGNAANHSLSGTITGTANTGAFGRVTQEVVGGGHTTHSVLYVVNSGRALEMTTDPESTSGLAAGEIRAQKNATYSAASLHGGSVGYSEGVASFCAGVWTFNGAGNASYSFIGGGATGIDYNVFYPESGALSYSVSANGRVTTSGTLGPDAPGGLVFYLVGQNEGFVMSTDDSAAGGYFEPQAPVTFSNASFSGKYMLRTIAPVVSGAIVESGEVSSPGDGTFNLTVDTSNASGVLNTGQAVPDEILVYPDGLGIDDYVLPNFVYLISPKKAILVWETGTFPLIMVLER